MYRSKVGSDRTGAKHGNLAGQARKTGKGMASIGHNRDLYRENIHNDQAQDRAHRGA